MTDWTADRIIELKRLWYSEGLSAAEIGKRMHISRSAVLGKLWRENGKQPTQRSGKTRPPTGLRKFATGGEWQTKLAELDFD